MFAFGQPHSSGAVDHLRVDGSTLHIDVGELYKETRQAISHVAAAQNPRFDFGGYPPAVVKIFPFLQITPCTYINVYRIV